MSSAVRNLVLVVLSLALPSAAWADNFYYAIVTLTDNSVTVGDPGHARVDFGFPFSSISQVCFYFTFGNDPLDPHERVTLVALDSGSEIGGPGFENVGTTPEFSRTLCNLSPSAFNNVFLDGVENDLAMLIFSGSVTIQELQVQILGTPAIVAARPRSWGTMKIRYR